MAKKPAALQDDTVANLKEWVNKPRNAAMLAGGLIGVLLVGALFSKFRNDSQEAALIAKAMQLANDLGAKAQEFEAAQHRFPFGNGEIAMPDRSNKSWTPLTVAEIRADGTAYFEYPNPRGGFESNPQIMFRLRDSEAGKAGTCVAGPSVKAAALSKNGLNCDTREIPRDPPDPPASAMALVAPPAPVSADPAAVATDTGEVAMQPTQHLAVSRDVAQADQVISAIDRDDAEALKQAKAQGVAVCEPNPEGRLPIVEAARSGQMKSLAFLISAPCPLQQLEPFSQSTALISAISLRNAPAANMLLAAGADPNFAPPGKPGPWQLLGDGEEAEIMQLRDALHARGVDINVQATDGSTLLVRAAGRGSAEMVRWLIGRGANLNVQDKRGRTAVMAAALTPTPESLRIVQALIAARADLNLRDTGNYTVLGRVMLMTEDPVRQKEVQQMLMRAGAKG